MYHHLVPKYNKRFLFINGIISVIAISMQEKNYIFCIEREFKNFRLNLEGDLPISLYLICGILAGNLQSCKR